MFVISSWFFSSYQIHANKNNALILIKVHTNHIQGNGNKSYSLCAVYLFVHNVSALLSCVDIGLYETCSHCIKKLGDSWFTKIFKFITKNILINTVVIIKLQNNL